MIPTGGAVLAQSGNRFSRTNGFVGPEIMRGSGGGMDRIMRKTEEA
jgi:hypothetical protein